MPEPTKWNKPTNMPEDGTEFIYISSSDKSGNRIVSKARWQDADEDHDCRFYDSDIGDEADIAGWLPMPEFETDPQ